MKYLILTFFVSYVSCDHLSQELKFDELSLVDNDLINDFDWLSIIDETNNPDNENHQRSRRAVSARLGNWGKLVDNGLKFVKNTMKDGNETFYIPKLDPYYFKKTNMLYENPLTLNGEVDGTLINLSNFICESVYVCLPSMVLQLGFILENIQLKGFYNVSGSLYDILPVYGFGDYSFEAKKINLTLTTQFHMDDQVTPLTIILNQVNINEIKGPKLNFGEIFGEALLADILNKFSNDVSSVFLDKNLGLVEDFFGKFLQKRFEKILNNANLIEVNQYLKKIPKVN